MITAQEAGDVMRWLAAVDGHERGEVDVAVWMDAAAVGRWSAAETVAAVREVGREFTGFRVKPGDVDAKIRAARRLIPPPSPDMLAIEAPDAGHPPSEARKRALAEWTEKMGRRKSVPRAFEPTPQGSPERVRFDAYAGVDECPDCDQSGMRLDAPDIVCGHHRSRANSGMASSSAAPPN